MATVFKTFLNNDVATTRTLLNEAIPIDGKLMFGSYLEPGPSITGEDTNIKTFPHEMFQSVYDYPFLKSSSNHIFDITLGYASDTLLDTTVDPAKAKKEAIYNQFAQVMVGHDKDGNILKFDEDGNILEGGDKYDEAYLLSVARLLNKDEMKKGSLYLQLDYAVTEPGQRLYTPVPSPVDTAYPLAAAPSLPFNDAGGPPNIPAGFFECNAAANAAVALQITSGTLGSSTDVQFQIDSTAVTGGQDTVYFFSTAGLPGTPVGPSPGLPLKVLVFAATGGVPATDTATTLQNLTDAINNADGIVAGQATLDGRYAYYDEWVADPTVVATFNGTDTVTITSTVAGVDGENITTLIAGDSTGAGDEIGSLGATAFDAVAAAGAWNTGSVSLALSADTTINSDDYRRISMIITDEGAQNDYRVNSPAGDYGILKIKEYKIEKWDAVTNTISDVCVIDAEALETAADTDTGTAPGDLTGYDRKIGLVYYQAGVVAITPYAFVAFLPGSVAPSTAPDEWSVSGAARVGRLPFHFPNATPASSISWWNSTGTTPTDSIARSAWTSCTEAEVLTDSVCSELPIEAATFTTMIDGLTDVQAAWEGAPIDSSTGDDSNATGFRRRMVRMAFNNTTELNSTIYFARLNNNEFNYSANPTYLNESKIRVKETTLDAPVSYITSVGLYSADNELLAQAKLSEPVRKDPTNEFVLRVRLDY